MIEKTLGKKLNGNERDEIQAAVDAAILKSVGRAEQTAVDTMLRYPLEDQDKAHKMADELRRKNVALIANLSSQR